MHPKDNPGKREREAGKRHRRARYSAGADQAPLKLGRKKMWIRFRKSLYWSRTGGHQSVADPEHNA